MKKGQASHVCLGYCQNHEHEGQAAFFCHPLLHRAGAFWLVKLRILLSDVLNRDFLRLPAWGHDLIMGSCQAPVQYSQVLKPKNSYQP